MLHGNVPILATAFTDDDNVDLKSMERFLGFLLEQGIDGIGLFGNASEGYALTGREKEEIFALVRSLAPTLPVVAGAGGASIVPALESLRQMEKLGADIAMVNPPSVVKPDPGQCYDFYAALAKGCGMEIMIQDAPMMSGVAMPVDILVRLCRDFPTIRYIKAEAPPTTLKITKLKTELGDAGAVFGGLNGAFLFEELERGIVGTMPACEFPDVVNAILRAHAAGDIAGARDAFYRYLPFIRYGTQPGIGVSVHKEVLHTSGAFATRAVRMPAKVLDETTRNELDHLLKTLPLAIMTAFRTA